MRYKSLLAMLAIIFTVSGVSAREKGVEDSIVIKGSPEFVFQHIQMSRTMEPARRKLISHEGNEAVIQEHFEDVPMLGKVNCTYKEVEVPGKSIEFKMLTSDKFRTFEGIWQLSPVDNGASTLVKLHSLTEPKINIPFASAVGNPSALKDVHRRLHNLKQWTEKDCKCELSKAVGE